jgi:hypothetical protein
MVINEVIFRNVDKEAVESILGKAMKDGVVDFSVLVPPPLNIWQGNISGAVREAFSGNVWREWNINNWGTKWNAFDTLEPVYNEQENTLTVTFSTALSPPRPWLCALLNAARMPFQYNWLEEGSSKAHTEEYYFTTGAFSQENTPCWKESEASEELCYRLYHTRIKKKEAKKKVKEKQPRSRDLFESYDEREDD